MALLNTITAHSPVRVGGSSGGGNSGNRSQYCGHKDHVNEKTARNFCGRFLIFLSYFCKISERLKKSADRTHVSPTFFRAFFRDETHVSLRVFVRQSDSSTPPSRHASRHRSRNWRHSSLRVCPCGATQPTCMVMSAGKERGRVTSSDRSSDSQPEPSA